MLTRSALLSLLAVAGSLPAALAQAPVEVRIGPRPGYEIPADFAGLSFETSNLNPDREGRHLFSSGDRPLIDLLRVIGVRNLRLGGGTADGPGFRIPGPDDIDALLAFAKAADLRIIYTLRLLNGSSGQDAQLAQYLEQRLASRLVCLAVGNEPDWHSFHSSPDHERDPRIAETTPGIPGTAYPSFLEDWRGFARAIGAAAPGARLTGPDTGSDYPVAGARSTDVDGQSWTERLAHDERGSGRLVFVTLHDYPGQDAKGVSVDAAVASMLSRAWLEDRYEALFRHVLAPVEREGLRYRLTEANDYTGGVDGASNAFASALWALDYLHWHAAHGAAGVNFHNRSWIYTDTVLRAPDGSFHLNPKAYALKAFDVGGHGRVLPVSVSNPEDVNMTAYAVRAGGTIYVTLINKEHGREHGAPGRAATVTVRTRGLHGEVMGMALEAPGGSVTAREGITLGGAPLTIRGWNGRWSSLSRYRRGSATVLLSPGSALILRL